MAPDGREYPAHAGLIFAPGELVRVLAFELIWGAPVVHVGHDVRTFAWLHAFKRLETRYERRGDIHQGLLGLACCIICLRRLHTDF